MSGELSSGLCLSLVFATDALGTTLFADHLGTNVPDGLDVKRCSWLSFYLLVESCLQQNWKVFLYTFGGLLFLGGTTLLMALFFLLLGMLQAYQTRIIHWRRIDCRPGIQKQVIVERLNYSAFRRKENARPSEKVDLSLVDSIWQGM